MKVEIQNKDYLFFNNFAILKNLDAVASTFSFTGKFNPKNSLHRRFFNPLAFHEIKIYKDGNLLLTGNIVQVSFNSKDNPDLVKVTGYSKAGILEDCNIPYELYSLESNNKSLKEIYDKILAYFGLNLIIKQEALNDSNLKYTKSVASASESVKNYLAKLSAQRNIILSHDLNGNVVLKKPKFNETPKLSLNKTNMLSCALSVNGQIMHSEITVLRQPSRTNTKLTPVDTVKNSLVKIKRPKVRTMSSGIETDTKKTANNELAKELKSIIFSVDLNGFYLLEPGDLVEIENDEVYLFQKTRLVISQVRYEEKPESFITSLALTLPESFTGEEPKNIFSYD